MKSSGYPMVPAPREKRRPLEERLCHCGAKQLEASAPAQSVLHFGAPLSPSLWVHLAGWSDKSGPLHVPFLLEPRVETGWSRVCGWPGSLPQLETAGLWMAACPRACSEDSGLPSCQAATPSGHGGDTVITRVWRRECDKDGVLACWGSERRLCSHWEEGALQGNGGGLGRAEPGTRKGLSFNKQLHRSSNESPGWRQEPRSGITPTPCLGQPQPTGARGHGEGPVRSLPRKWLKVPHHKPSPQGGPEDQDHHWDLHDPSGLQGHLLPWDRAGRSPPASQKRGGKRTPPTYTHYSPPLL